MIKNYEYIINHEEFIICMDFDSTIIWTCREGTEIVSTGEWLSDVAISMWERIWNYDLYEEIDSVSRRCMSEEWACFSDSLNARFDTFVNLWIQQIDINVWAKRARFSKGFEDYVKVMNLLQQEKNLDYEQFFILSGGFYEMISDIMIPVLWEERAKRVIKANFFKYKEDQVIGWDQEESLMFRENAKKLMVDELRSTWEIAKGMKVSWIWDGSNDVNVSDPDLFVAFTGNSRRKEVVEKASGVEATNFYEVLVFHTSPEDRAYIKAQWWEYLKILKKGIRSLRARLPGIEIS